MRKFVGRLMRDASKVSRVSETHELRLIITHFVRRLDFLYFEVVDRLLVCDEYDEILIDFQKEEPKLTIEALRKRASMARLQVLDDVKRHFEQRRENAKNVISRDD